MNTQKRTYLFVATDMGAASVTAPVAEELHALGHNVCAITERKAGEKFPKLAPSVTTEIGPLGSMQEAIRLLEFIKPDVIVTGLSSPAHNESLISLAALELQRRGVGNSKLVWIEDRTGCHVRIKDVVPHYIFTPNQAGVDMVRHNLNIDAEIAGDPGFSEFDGVLSYDYQNLLHRLLDEFGHVCCFSETGLEPGTSQVKRFLDCVAMTPGSVCVIPMFHPKRKKQLLPGTDTFCHDVWRSMLVSEMGADRVIDFGDTQTGCIATYPGVIMTSGYSTLMKSAGQYGNRAVSLWTDEVQAFHLKESGDEGPPEVVTIGLAALADKPLSFECVLPPSDTCREGLMPFDHLLVVKKLMTI